MLHLSTLSLLHVLVAPQIPIDFCPSVTADATATLAAGEDGDAVDTYGRGYADAPRTCRRFVTDFSVAPSAAPDREWLETTFEVSGGMPLDLVPRTAASCATATASITVYKKAAGQAAFTKLGTHTRKGTWTEGKYCALQTKSGTVPKGTANAAGTDVYRVAITANVPGPVAGARATIAFMMPTPQ